MALSSLEYYYKKRNGKLAEEETSAKSTRRKSSLENYFQKNLNERIGRINFDSFDNDLKTTNELLMGVYNNWQDADSMTANKERVSSMYNQLKDLSLYTKYNGKDATEIEKVMNAYDSALKEWDNLTKYYGGFKSGEAYTNYMAEQARLEELAKQSAFDDYRHLLDDEEFMSKANYKSASKNISLWDKITGKADFADVHNENREGWLGDTQRFLQKLLPTDSAKYGYLTDEELAVYYGFVAKEDYKSANKFLDDMSKELNKRMTNKRMSEMSEVASSNGFMSAISAIGSVGYNFLGGAQSVLGDVRNLITGDEADANDASHYLSNMGDALRGGVSDYIREDSEALAFIFDTSMSITDSVLNVVALGGAGAVANMGMKAYSSKMKEMQDMGASQSEMILTSALAGGIEALTERVSVGNLLKPKGVTTLRRFIGETFKQAGVEASEEWVSSVLNQTVDALNGFALDGTSTIKADYEDYLLRGYTEEEARNEVMKEARTERILSAISGAISGGFTGGVSNASQGIENRNIGKFVTNNNRLGELTDLATEVGPIGEGKHAVDYASQLQNSPNKATIGYAYKNVAEEANRQADELDSSETKELVTRRLVEMGESGETAMDLADAIIADSNGKANASQRKMIQNSGIAADAINDIKNSAEWTTKSTEGLRKAQGMRDKLKSISTMRDADVMKAEQRASTMNISDTTTDIETGNEIDIEGVRFDADGEAILQTSEGERKLSEVTLTSNNAIAIAYAQDMDREAADTFVSLYDGKQDFEAYKDSFELVWNYGKDGYGSDSVLSHLGNLTESQALSIYKAGMTSEVAKAQKAVNVLRNRYKGFSAVGSFDDSVIDYNGTDSSKVNFNELNDNQKQNIIAAKAIAEGLGLRVQLFSSKHGENKANGYYDPKTNTIGIDVFAEQRSGSLNNGITTAMSHEMTHWMKDKSPKLYNEMRELVMNGLSGASGVSGDVLAAIEAYRMDNRHGEGHTDSQAIDELIARACEDMLSNSKVAKNILENMTPETRASFVDRVKEFLAKIKEAISSIMGRFDSESREAVMLREMDGMADKMAELWDSMLEDSVETNDALNAKEVEPDEYQMAASDKALSEKIGVGFDSETNSVYPKQFSLKTWTESEYQQNVDNAVKDIAKKLKVSEKKARQYIENVNSIAKMIADDRQRLDYESNIDENATSLKENSEYKWTVDMSTLCAKRLLFTGTFDKIQKKLMNTALTSEDIVKIRQMMEDRGYTVACGICYVESTRREMGPITEEFIKQYKEAQKNGTAIHRINSEGKAVALKEKGTQRNFFPEEGYTPTLADLNTTDIDLVKRDHPEVYGAYLSFMNARGQAKPKLLETRTEYKGEILKHFNSKSAVKSRNDAGGLRVQSFSDFEVAHLIDMMQIAMDMSRVGLYSQAYTKVPAFADIFGGTGMKINLSLIAKGDGLDKDGNLIFDDVEGIDHNEAFRLRDKWSENVGTILVGKNDAHIIKAMSDPRIDYIIPFHKSSWKESLYSALGLTGYGDYTDTQNEKAIEKGRKIKNFAPSEYWDYSKTGDENAQTYLEMCKADGRIPKFPQFQTYEGYWKLLIDFKMYDNDGVGVPQRVVRPDFDMDAAEKILNEYEGGHRSFPVAEDVVEDFVAEYKGEHPGVQYSDKTEYSYDSLVSKGENGSISVAKLNTTLPRKADGLYSRAEVVANALDSLKRLSGNVRIAHNDDSDIDIVVNRNSLEHSLRSEDSAIVAQGIKDIIRHSIKVNEMKPRSNAKSSSVYLGYGMDENGHEYIARLIVVEKDGRGVLEDYNLLYAANAKKIEAVSSTTIGNGIASPTASTIKISSLLHHVKDNFLFRDSVSRDVLDKLGVSRVDTKFSEGLIYSDKDMVVNGKTARFTDERIDRLFREFGASDPKYAQAYVASINPRDFLRLTIRDEVLDKWNKAANEGNDSELYALDTEKLRNQTQTPFLIIDTETGEVEGHEGRHRMRALMDAGVSDVPIVIIDYKTKYSKQKELVMTLTSQDYGNGNVNNGATVDVRNLIPTNKVYEDDIKSMYGGSADIRYSDKDSDGNGLTDAQVEYFAKSKMRDKNGKLKPMYHGTELVGHTIFDPSYSDDGISLFFTDNKTVAKGYSGTYDEFIPDRKLSVDEMTDLLGNSYYRVEENDGKYQILRYVPARDADVVEFEADSYEEMMEHIREEWSGYGSGNYKVYLNLKNPLVVKGDGRNWDDLPLTQTKNVDRYNYIYVTEGMDGKYNVEWEDMLNKYGDAESAEMSIDEIRAKFGDYVADGVEARRSDFEGIVLDTKTKSLVPRTTRQYAYVAKKNGNDGVIFDDIYDIAVYASGSEKLEPSTVAIAFDSNQVKSVANENPTEADDFRYSDKGSDGEELGSYYKNLARKLESENKYLKTRHANYKARIEKARRIEQITKKASRMNNLLKKNSKDYHVPEILKGPLEAVLSALDFSSKSLLRRGEPTGKDVKLAEAFSNLQDVLIGIDNAQIKEEDINGIYGHFDMPEGFVEYVRDVKQSINDTIGKMDGEPIVLNRLTKEELDNVYDILTILNKSISQMDKALATTKAAKISTIANSSRTYLESIQKMGNELPLMQKMKKFLAWDNVLPVYGMSRFGEGGDIIMDSLQNGWDKLAFNVNRVVEYSKDTYTKNQLKEWEGNTKTFSVANGNKRKEITLTDSQIMSLYCLSKREQALGHILGNGITVGSHDTKEGTGKIKIKKKTQEDHALITKGELDKIISSLSAEQVAVADKLQGFMNTVCAEWGNQVSMVRFGIKSFGEENYFPIKSDSNVIESKASESGDSLFRLLNMSFTKSLTKSANNAIMVDSIFDVFAGHSSDMAKYNALALPVLDAFKWYSAKGSTRDENGRVTDSWSLKRTMDDAYGQSAKGFVRRLLLDMNGASSGGQDLVAEGWSKKLMSNYKLASVAANLRVAVLQPTSYIRAGLVLDKKYLTQALVTRESTLKNGIKKAKETCGMALWKSMGFYDTNISRGVTKLIKHDESFWDVAKDKSLILAEKGDEITWGLLYRACLLEQKDKNPNLSGDALDKAVAERLREVIYKTQVVDSTLTRTQNMRSKSGLAQMLTSFMSEPSVSWSILSDVAFKWMVEARGGNHKRAFAKYGKQMKDAAMTYLVTATVASIVGAIPDALRDDDEDKDFAEKFTVSTLENLLSDVTGILPYVKDISSMVQEFTPTRMDQQAFVTTINGLKRTTDGEVTYKDIYTLVKGLSLASGMPMSNLMREFSTLWNNTVGNIYPSTKLK